jgi:uncharacterized protein (UPF0335 family)
MTDTAGIPGDRICSFVERIEHIDEEIKAEGFDVKVLREILRRASRTKTSATNRSPCSTAISGLWESAARRNQRRHSAGPTWNFRSLNESAFSASFRIRSNSRI